MSIRALEWARTQQGRVSSEAGTVLRWLALRASTSGECFPTTKTIAWGTALSSWQVEQCLGELRAAGILADRDALPVLGQPVRVLSLQVPGLVAGLTKGG